MFNRFVVVLLAAFVFALGGDVRPAHAGGRPMGELLKPAAASRG